jgi:hypothetical protein
MLTSAEIESLRLIRSGATPPHQHELSSLIDKGYVQDNAGSYALTELGHSQIGVLEDFGDAIIDAVIPGIGAEQSEHPASRKDK